MNHRAIVAAKLASLLGFVVLVISTYYLRSEVLALSHIRFSADEVRAANELQELRETEPDRKRQYEAAEKHYQLELEHYRSMLELYHSDYDEYVKRLEDKFQPPPMPSPPSKPDAPEIAQRLYELNVDFRTRKNQYFERTSRLVWIDCVAAVMLVGGLVWLLLFDVQSPRWHYLAALLISFVFLIGPALHSFLTGIIGFLQEPGIH
jgi:hypothetical protein